MYNTAKALVPVINKLILLANAHRIAYQEFQRKHPSGSNGTENLEAYLSDPLLRETRVAIQEYLNHFGQTEVNVIMSVMYIGRDERSYLQEPRERDEDEEYEEQERRLTPHELIAVYYKNFMAEAKNNAIEQMIEKTPLATYLENGLIILNLR